MLQICVCLSEDAPWCGHCKEFEPIYAEVAEKLKEEGAGMRLAKVDAIEEKELADEFEVGSFPTLKVFINGERKLPLDYTGRDAETFILDKYCRNYMQPLLTCIHNSYLNSLGPHKYLWQT